jgi:hypothetical protein
MIFLAIIGMVLSLVLVIWLTNKITDVIDPKGESSISASSPFIGAIIWVALLAQLIYTYQDYLETVFN